MYYAAVWPLNLVLSMTKELARFLLIINDFSCTSLLLLLLLLLLLQRTGLGACCFVTRVHMNDNLHCQGIAQG